MCFNIVVLMRDTLLILHFLGLVLGLGNGFAHLFLGIASKKLKEAEQIEFQKKIFAINKMGHIGLFLLILSGWFLMNDRWHMLSNSPTLIAKLVGVVVLVVLVVVMNGLATRFLKKDDYQALSKIEQIGKITLPLGIIIVVLAVLSFH